jgi:hypothetical protein
MKESVKNTNEFQLEGPSEQEDYRLPYELPKLRKHGQVSDSTGLILASGEFDIGFGPSFSDFS